jgi:hypothetical protein
MRLAEELSSVVDSPWTYVKPGIKDENLADCAHANGSIAEDALENISRLRVRKRETLIFIRELLVWFLWER